MRFVFSKENGGRKTYYSNIWDPARRCKIKKRLGNNLREAEELAEKLHAQVVARNLGVRPKMDAPMLDEFIPRFLTENYIGKVTQREATRSITRFRQFAGNIPLTSVTKGLLKSFVSLRRKDTVPGPFRGKSKSSPKAKTWIPKNLVRNGTVNRDIDSVKRMLAFAHEEEIIDWNPLEGFKKLSTKDNIRKPMLPPEQLQSLLDEALRSKDWRFSPAVVLALYTGRRKSDLFKRKTTDYNQTQGLLYLGKTKKGEDEWIRLAGAARRALDVLVDHAVNGWLFPNAGGTGPIQNMNTAFREAKKRAGIDPGLRWHDLRHISISYYLEAGVDPTTLCSLVGHTTPTMIEQRYGHLSRKHKEATSMIFGGYMDRITGLGSEIGEAPETASSRAISAQVADLISGEAAKSLVVQRLLPGSSLAPQTSTPTRHPAGPGDK